MERKSNDKERTISAVKEWLTPSLISIVGLILWTELTKLQDNVQTLLERSAITETKLAMLEKEIDYIKSKDNYGTCQQSTTMFPYERATPKKEDGPKVPTPDGNDKERL